MLIKELAPAKINLNLLVTGENDKGYHTLSSFITFAEFGDEIHLEAAPHFSFEITGPFASQLKANEDNLCTRAYHLLRLPQPVKMTLVKNMPVASGIGGGSADAGAVLRGLIRLFDLPISEDFESQLLGLGADVPACFKSKPCHMAGIGDILTPISLPSFHLLLINPNVAVSTPQIFGARKDDFSKRLMHFPSNLFELHNDLEAPACSLFPVIKDALKSLADSADCQLARMSGSGATCFGVYPDAASAKLAENEIRKEYPTWWTTATHAAGS